VSGAPSGTQVPPPPTTIVSGRAPGAFGAPAGPAGEGSPVAALRDVSAGYRDRLVLRGVSLAIEAGERVALLGPNGAGKSTILRVLAGILPARTGEVLLGGEPVARLRRAQVARRLAAVPGGTSLPFAARVDEVVGLGRLPWEDPFRGPRAEDRAAVAVALERVGITALRDRDARELSLGERQLVLLAMAVAQGAPLLVLDEPTVHLDLRHQVAVMELLAELNARDGTTILAVLHDLALARHFFPRLVLVDGGRVVADGPPRHVLEPERVRAVFGVDPGILDARAAADELNGGGGPR
jgi:ABC-type cobalamin/Fe3+-siderophores transport system ATPase subunit